MNSTPGKRVLICPLDWGLGHAGRDVQIIEELISNGFEVIIGADDAPLFFLIQHFKDLSFVKIPSFKIKYHAGRSMAFQMLLSIPKIMLGILKEHRKIQKLITDEKIDMLISDNRYGLWSKKAYCIFITHQLQIQVPKYLKFSQGSLNYINHWFINKYNECWIPDLSGETNLSGKLSHQCKLPKKINYIGILSRFKSLNNKHLTPIKHFENFDILVILSGPEPQRSIFEKILFEQISNSNYSALFVQGKPLLKNEVKIGKISFVNHLETDILNELIINASVIISRSGYSTIMDLVTLHKTAILVPTPGQTEQEYLAEIMLEKKYFYTVSQKEFELEKAMQSLNDFNPQINNHEKDLLADKIKALNT